ncbi:MAG TPA: MerR family transcriptional regulator [Jatrophihabitans sp.]|nr:MerR family transcriptional regulator [Jatrophihabitans sp.]
MFSIGEFAKHGRVSVRMLRHYDAIGLLPPARVDPVTGYRSYQAGQLSQLNRIIALRDLGFGLDQIAELLAEKVDLPQLWGMLRLRQAELRSALAAGTAQLGRVEARLRIIESEGQMPTDEVVLKSLPAVRVAELTDVAGGFTPEDISPVIRPLCAELGRRLQASQLQPTGRLLAYYEQPPGDEDQLVVHAAIPVSGPQRSEDGLVVLELAGCDQAATIVHRGSMDAVLGTVDTLARWIEANGYADAGAPRELYLECPDDPDRWVTELQQPVRPA